MEAAIFELAVELGLAGPFVEQEVGLEGDRRLIEKPTQEVELLLLEGRLPGGPRQHDDAHGPPGRGQQADHLDVRRRELRADLVDLP